MIKSVSIPHRYWNRQFVYWMLTFTAILIVVVQLLEAVGASVLTSVVVGVLLSPLLDRILDWFIEWRDAEREVNY